MFIMFMVHIFTATNILTRFVLTLSQDGTARGTVTRLVENPASDLLELDSGTLVPVQFVVSHTPNDKIHVDAPVGLFDLDEAASERDQD